MELLLLLTLLPAVLALALIGKASNARYWRTAVLGCILLLLGGPLAVMGTLIQFTSIS